MSKLLSARERLGSSREALRQAVNDTGLAAKASDPGGSAPWLLVWLASLTSTTPATGLLIDVLHAWWVNHPMRLAWVMAVDTAQVLLKPLAQRQPYALVAGAALVGGLLVLLRPWRWIPTSAWLSGLLPELLAQAMKHRPAAATGTTDRAK